MKAWTMWSLLLSVTVEVLALSPKGLHALPAVTTAAVKSDPIFDGFHGFTYEVKGRHDGIYALLSDPKHQLNALFQMGLEESADHLWMTSVALVYGMEVDVQLELNKDAANLPSSLLGAEVKALVNGEDASDSMLSGEEVESHDGNTIIVFEHSRGQWNNTGVKDSDGAEGWEAGVPLISVQTPTYEFNFSLVVDTRPWGGTRKPTPHIDVAVNIRQPVLPSQVNGLLGESMRWSGQTPAERGKLQADDQAYEVNTMLSHDFKFSTFQGPSVTA